MNNILVVAPHCDDEVLGCGGIMALYSSLGANVFVVIVTNGHKGAPELFSREGTEKVRLEAIEAHKILGVKKTFFLDFPALNLEEAPPYKLANSLKKIIYENSIQILFVPHRGDIHHDHTITFTSALVAARPIDKCPVKKILAYETLSETEWAPPFVSDVFIPTEFVNITSCIDKKKLAFDCFNTQKKQFPHPRSIEGIENLSKFRGATVGLINAEAFMLIRNIIN